MAEKFRTNPMLLTYSNVSIALKDDGTVWSWGTNNYGFLGNINVNIAESNWSPSQVSGLDGVGVLTDVKELIAASPTPGAINSDGSIYLWGQNSLGQLGIGSTASIIPYPVKVKGVGGVGYLTNIKKVVGANGVVIALSNDGTIYGWGGNNDTLEEYSTTPLQLYPNLLTGIIDIAYNTRQSACALKSDGTVLSWGNGMYTGTGNSQSVKITPTLVVDKEGQSIRDIVKLHDRYAVDKYGVVYGWGDNIQAGLGIGNVGGKSQIYATQVLNEDGSDYLRNIVEVAGYSYRTVAFNSTGEAFVWGIAREGDLGLDPLTTPEILYLPRRSPLLDNSYIRSPLSTSFAKSDGTVWAVGKYAYDLANSGETGDTHVPQQVFETPGGEPFNLFTNGKPIDPPGPGPDPEPGNDCCNCCGCCRPIVLNNCTFTGPVNIHYDGCGNCHNIECEAEPEE